MRYIYSLGANGKTENISALARTHTGIQLQSEVCKASAEITPSTLPREVSIPDLGSVKYAPPGNTSVFHFVPSNNHSLTV